MSILFTCNQQKKYRGSFHALRPAEAPGAFYNDSASQLGLATLNAQWPQVLVGTLRYFQLHTEIHAARAVYRRISPTEAGRA